MLTRRDFLARSALGLSAISVCGQLPAVFAQAANSAVLADANDHTLVVIELNGGNDGLNTVVPFEDPLYYKNRPTLKVAKEQVIKLSHLVGLHPSMGPAGELFKAGKLAIVQGVGYPGPDRSHFRSMEIWHTASTAQKVPLTGWLGRVLDQCTEPNGKDHLRALALTGALPQALQSDKYAVPVIQQLEGFAGGAAPMQPQKLLRKLSKPHTTAGDATSFLRQQAEETYRTAERLRVAAANFKSTIEYPGDLGQQLRRAAQVITANMGVRLVFASHGTYDTHSQQAVSHGTLLGELAGSLAAFQKDLEDHKVADRVTVMVFSEFGRRVDENASLGTDHGAASCMFLLGSKVKGGLVGIYPSLEKLGDGDLIHTVDFRHVYTAVLEKWLGCSAEKLLGGKFKALELFV